MKSIIINGITVTEGQQYRHLKTNEVYTITVNREGKFKFDNNIIHVDVTAERLNKVILI